MLRNKTGAVLIALQIAFTMTVVVNSYFMIRYATDQMGRASGLVEDELFHINSVAFKTDFNAKATVVSDLDLLRSTPGIKDAVQINSVPLSQGGWSMALQLEPGEGKQAFGTAVYMVDEHGIGTMGVDLIAGENFAASDIEWRNGRPSWPPKAIVTEAMAELMFPDATPHEAVGKTVYIDTNQPVTLIGVVERLQAPWSGSDMVERSMLVPQMMEWGSTTYLVRTEAGRRDAMMPVIEEALARSNRDRIIRNNSSMAETRERSYRDESAIATILLLVMGVLVIITAFGIVGLASFSVNRRIKQIGTRRALGATKADIVRYFLIENGIITGIGVVLGVVMTVGFNVWLADLLGFAKIDWLYLPLGMLVLLLIGLGAALGPALRASDVPPAVATRTV
jgi:putative ABC transport system permease protein